MVIDSNLDEGTITILSSSGITRTLQLRGGEQLPSAGDLVTAFVEPAHVDGGTAPSIGFERVTGLTRAVDVRDRLESDLEEIASGGGDLNGTNQAVKENHVESLTELLDQQTSNHVERLKSALDHSTQANQRSLIGALDDAQDAHQKGKILGEQIRAAISDEANGGVGENTSTDSDNIYLNKFPHNGEGEIKPVESTWQEYMHPEIAARIMEGFQWYNKKFKYGFKQRVRPKNVASSR